MNEWEDLAGWWRHHVADDAVFHSDVAPLVVEMVGGAVGERRPWLELGCGEGRVMRLIDGPVVGCDVSPELAAAAARIAPVALCRLPDLRWVRPGSVAGAVAVLTAEHLPDLAALFGETHRVTAAGGALVVVANHPGFTAEGSGPIVDPSDGEVLWRWGRYFDERPVETHLDAEHAVTFHHRTLASILTTAAATGWSLQRCVERPLSAAAITAEPGYEGQDTIPRLIGLRWRSV